MSWFIVFGLFGVVVGAGAAVGVRVNRQRVAERAAREMHRSLALPHARAARRAADRLPPAARYRQPAEANHALRRTLRPRHGEPSRSSPTPEPRPIRVPPLTFHPPGSSALTLTGLSTLATRPFRGWAKAAMVLEIALGVGALGGGLALMIGPHGEVIPLPVAALAGSPFASYLVPGVILFAILGVGPLVAAVCAGRRTASAPYMALAVGCALVVWIAVEIAIVGYSNKPPLQAVYLALGVVIMSVGGGWVRVSRSGAVGTLQP